MHIEWTHETEDGEEVVEHIPAKWEICDTCEGHGKHSRNFGAITSDEWNGPDWDDESRETYLSGGYDTACEDCNGSGKVKRVDEERAPKDLLTRYQEHCEQEARWRAQDAYERRMGY